jgi:hypothetical protein
MRTDTSEIPAREEVAAASGRRLLVRSLLLALAILAVLVGGLAVVSILSDDSQPLTFRYEGFD